MTSPSLYAPVADYLALRREMGYELRSQGLLLLDFARFADRQGHVGPITVDLARRWAMSTRASESRAAARRLSVVRQFARHRLAFDAATQVPPVGLLGPETAARRQPHVYSDEEIALLLRAAALLRPRGGLRPRTYVAFFSLLASTGLRLCEARLLPCRDVDLAEGLLVVREGKFRKSRVVPLHPTSTAALARYATCRDRTAPRSEFFFRTDRAPALGYFGIERTFATLRRRLGWTRRGGARQPRIHDLRHTFAVRRLLRWYEEGADVDRKVHALATYLGHAGVAGTYWYLTAVPELMAVTSRRFDQFAGRRAERLP